MSKIDLTHELEFLKRVSVYDNIATSETVGFDKLYYPARKRNSSSFIIIRGSVVFSTVEACRNSIYYRSIYQNLVYEISLKKPPIKWFPSGKAGKFTKNVYVHAKIIE